MFFTFKQKEGRMFKKVICVALSLFLFAGFSWGGKSKSESEVKHSAKQTKQTVKTSKSTVKPVAYKKAKANYYKPMKAAPKKPKSNVVQKPATSLSSANPSVGSTVNTSSAQ